jgi:uncharacterized protein YbaP (TraB family)
LAEQTRLLELTIEAIEKGAEKAQSPTRALVDAYLTGDLAVVSRIMNEAVAADRELMTRFTAVALDSRNQTMAERIRTRRAERPDTVTFYAVGAAHFAGETGIVALLQKAGLKVTRVTEP